MQLIIDTAVLKRKLKALRFEMTLKMRALRKQAKLAGEILILLLKAGYYKMFRAQIVVTTNIDVDGYKNVHELKGVPSVTPGFVRLNYRQTVNGYEKTRSSTLVSVTEWDSVCRRADYGAGRLARID